MNQLFKIIYPMAILTVVGLILIACGAAASSETPATRSVTPTPTLPPLPTLGSDEVILGRQVYVEQCAACHGQNAEGQSNWQQPDTNGNMPAPPHDDSGHTWHHADGLLYEIIRDGSRDPLKPPGSPLTMPAFGDKLSDAEIRAVITYFKSLWTEESRMYQWEVTQQQPFPTVAPTGGQ
ncbi:MAG TPA: cytochrome c [Anaerolineae bacterium]|jgi:mono/diheme cytochrome c family protein